MGDIFERPDKKGKPRYTARARIKGCKPVSKTFGRKTDATQWLIKTEAALLENRDFPEREENKHTVNDLLNEYKTNGFMDKPDSKDKQANQLDWWAKQFGYLELKNLTPKIISNSIFELKERKNRYGKNISNSTVNRYKSALSAALTYANEGIFWMTRNPARMIKQLKENKGRERYLSKMEFLKLVRAISEIEGTKLLPLFLLAIATGMRKSEMLRIRWRHIDLVKGTIFVPTSKNGEARTLPIDGLALTHLLKLNDLRQPKSELVFHGENPTTPMNFEKAWREARRKAGIKDFRWHDNRHTAAAFFRKSGASIADIADILGHKTLTVSWRYSKIKVEEQRPQVKAMNDKFLPSDLLEQAQKVELGDEP